MAYGWIVLAQLEAGRGELESHLYAVALDNHRDATEAVRRAPEVVQPRVVLGNRAPRIHDVQLVGALSARTIDRLGLVVGELWRL